MIKWGGGRSVTQSGTIQQVSFLLICVYIEKVHSQKEQRDSNNSRKSYTIEGLGIVYRS